MSKVWRTLTVLVAVSTFIGVLAAVTIPSLLRARVSGGNRLPSYAQPAPALPPASTPAFARTYESDRAARKIEGFAPATLAPMDTEAYHRIVDNAFLAVADTPLSTFSIDVDTASYANVRRFLRDRQLPPKDAVRIEELINYFHFDYPAPEDGTPFSVTSHVAPCPWNREHRLVLLGLQARRLAEGQLPPRNLVFLLDVSGSMSEPRKLPLVKAAMGLLVDQLTERDRISIVVYAGASGLVLPPTSGDRKGEIRAALAALEAGGSTAGGAGIQLAYRTAQETFIEGGVNRVVLATDGDFNVGITSHGDLSRLIEEKRKTGVSLSVLGFGMGNLKDSTMEMLADKGNGNYAYIDTLAEARKVLVAEAGSTLVTVAKDVKLQVEFNPAAVSAYRLIGYENRVLADADFNDDTKDAGDMGAGHSVTALYEVVPAGARAGARRVDPLKYQEDRRPSAVADASELMTVKLRYKAPDADESELLVVAVKEGGQTDSADLRFAAAVAAFGMLLRDSEHKGTATFADVLELARQGRGEDAGGYRAEFIQLVESARSLAETRPLPAGG
jgi:Ca-activated chloride channel family protein